MANENNLDKDLYGRDIYGTKNNRAWNQHLYLQEKALETHEARLKQRDDAERQIKEMKEQRKEKNMTPDEYQGVWIKDDKVSFYRETLKESVWNPTLNDSEFTFILSRRGTNLNDDPLLLTINEGFENKAGDDSLTLRFEGDIPAAKKMIADAIKKFTFHRTTDQKVTIYQLKDYFNFHKEIKQGETPPLERRNFNSKEKIMSEEFEEVSADDYLATLYTTVPLAEEKKELSPKQQMYIEAANNARFQRKVIADAIKNGTLSCLPRKDGYADTTPAVNIMTPNKPYHSENLLFLKAFQKQEQNGFPTAEYVTYHQIDKAREAGYEVYPLKGTKGVSLIIGEQKNTDEWENKNIRLFNVAQINNPKLFKEWVGKELEDKAQKDLEKWQIQHGTGSKPPEKQKEKGPDEIVCTSTEPEKYLGQYFAAVSWGSKFKVSPEQASEFSEKMVNALYAPMEPFVNKEGKTIQPPINKQTQQPITDPFNLEKIGRKASEECVTFMRDLRMQIQKQNQPEQKQEQTQGFKR